MDVGDGAMSEIMPNYDRFPAIQPTQTQLTVGTGLRSLPKSAAGPACLARRFSLLSEAAAQALESNVV